MLRRRESPHALAVDMTGVKMGDRFVQIGCENPGRLGAIAAKVGLSGRAVAVVPDESSAARARKGAADAGVLVEIEVASPQRFSAGADAFVLAVVDDTGGLLVGMRAEDRVAFVRNVHAALRPGGRVMVISTAPRGGLGALLSRTKSGPPFDPTPSLEADGFRSVRKLAEREGLIFVEGVKPRT